MMEQLKLAKALVADVSKIALKRGSDYSIQNDSTLGIVRTPLFNGETPWTA